MMNKIFFIITVLCTSFALGMEEKDMRIFHAMDSGCDLEEIRALMNEIDLDDAQDYETPLYHAAQNGHTSVVKLFLGAGADPNVPDPHFGSTPLDAAAGEGHGSIVQLLIRAGADVNKSDCAGRLPIHEAAFMGHMAIVRQLVAAGAHMHAESGRTDCSSTPLAFPPLHTAARQGYRSMVQLLLENGANPKQVAGGGCTPLHLAAEASPSSTRPGYGDESDDESDDELALPTDYRAVIRMLIEAGADPDEGTTSKEHTPLFHSLFTGSRPRHSVARLLVAEGADPGKMLSLVRCATDKDISVLRFLANAGADRNKVLLDRKWRESRPPSPSGAR